MNLIRIAALGLAMAFVVPATVPSFAAERKSTVSKKTKTAKRTAGTGGAVTGVNVGQAGVMELTSQECKGLGGVVNSSTPDMSCTGGEACFTTDKHGVVRAKCIDEVAPD